MKFLSNILAKAGLIVDGTTTLNSVAGATVDTDRFLVTDSNVVKYRTGAQVLSDIGAQPLLTINDNADYRVLIGSSTPNTLNAATKLEWYNDYGILVLRSTASWGYGAEIDFDNQAVNGTQWGFYGGSAGDNGFMLYRYLPTQYELAYWNIDRYALRSDVKMAWSSTLTSFGPPDLALYRESAGLLQINNGTTNSYANLKLNQLTATSLAGTGTRFVVADGSGVLSAVSTSATISADLVTDYDPSITGTRNSVNKVFTLTQNFVAGSTRVFVNGIRYTRGASYDYVETGTNQITFTNAPDSGDLIVVDYVKA